MQTNVILAVILFMAAGAVLDECIRWLIRKTER